MSTTPPTGEFGDSTVKYDDIAVLTSNNIVSSEGSSNNFNIRTVPGVDLDSNGVPKKKIDENNKEVIEKYNDKIEYTWCNVVRKDDDKNLDA